MRSALGAEWIMGVVVFVHRIQGLGFHRAKAGHWVLINLTEYSQLGFCSSKGLLCWFWTHTSYSAPSDAPTLTAVTLQGRKAP